MAANTAELAYGKGRLPLRMDGDLADWCVIAPRHEAPLPDPHQAFIDACTAPTASPPLRELIAPGDHVTIVTSDGTRPVPNALLVPWLLEQLPVPDGQVTVLLGTGSHRPNTPAEIEAMFGAELARRVSIVNHDAFAPGQNAEAGRTKTGVPIRFDKRYTGADKRILLGFIEPHFFAGFSGGAKAIAPGIADIETIFHLHRYDLIAAPSSTWGIMDGNPLQQTIQECAAFCPPDFLINVTLNNDKAITAIFAGDYRQAHRAGCTHVRQQAMTPVPHAFPLVITSNSGSPLDQNLYQSVKGMSAAAEIVEPGGTILVASECADGIPEHGNFGPMLRECSSPQALDALVRGLPQPKLDQWQVQVFARILAKARIGLYSTLAPATARACHVIPTDDLQRTVEEHIRKLGPKPPIAILPEGPLTIPFIT